MKKRIRGIPRVKNGPIRARRPITWTSVPGFDMADPSASPGRRRRARERLVYWEARMGVTLFLFLDRGVGYWVSILYSMTSTRPTSPFLCTKPENCIKCAKVCISVKVMKINRLYQVLLRRPWAAFQAGFEGLN